ncbi:hypothetical protein O979_09140 [Mycobacterium avium subsp. paratuberculosis 10-4404]|nr:hypothetical protein O979_09140 [Mycobacterium avium subsp. paratuberculosis 10-4404]ETB33200.1 hypothetical protein O977_09770 [Mycobacterium avium subsp. paratuberculosis 10-5975]ETB52589.1 hypothetical protein O976_09065 [Mycobacterium avium subsp. paratuberculosis 10-8425]
MVEAFLQIGKHFITACGVAAVQLIDVLAFGERPEQGLKAGHL